jgi:4-hydroxybenzoate polyprenyltransferase
LMALGLVLSTFLNAPWYIPLAFFTLTLVFLYPLTRRVEAQTDSMFFSH